ncbi:hypothetical protein BT96DRAFT_528199 [Gymnopus androsaceus JB14]|uniref:Uncharacterized protein n=1 Tax=Gymnopus androsaceus JB14 TaxID=1447944 RepID=A0A6A4IM73_9AGAR|nr:hypothetical protein BT96DRAFT_528199 [Gymnopus androsaceus JB14]
MFFVSHCVLFQENDLRHYIGNVYTCPEHPALKADTAIPHQLCKLFNKLHIEHLIPAAILLGITTDAEYNTVVNDFDEKEREGMLFEESEFVSLSRLQKVAMKWAFGLPV